MAETKETTVQDTQTTPEAAEQAQEQTAQAPAAQETEQAKDAASQDAAAPPAEEPKQEEPAKEADPEPAKEEAAAKEEASDDAALKNQLLDAELRAAAALAGVPANRIAYAVRLADRAAAEQATDLSAFATQQMQQIIRDVPELHQPPTGTGSAGNRARQEPGMRPEDKAILDGFDKRF